MATPPRYMVVLSRGSRGRYSERVLARDIGIINQELDSDVCHDRDLVVEV